MLIGLGAAMTSDDLERALQENLKLRQELAANVAKAKASQRDGIAYRFGWVFYLTCLALIVLWLFGMVALLATSKDTIPEMVGEVMREPLAFLIWVVFPTIALYGLGRAVRYVLSGE
jgi:succinate dehydrogenase hydrophobic anchor subunit